MPKLKIERKRQSAELIAALESRDNAAADRLIEMLGDKLGNNLDWQLDILELAHEKVAARIEAHRRLLADLTR